MTTAEATISMVNQLSDTEMLDVQKYIKKIFARREKKVGREEKPLGKKRLAEGKSSSRAKTNFKRRVFKNARPV